MGSGNWWGGWGLLVNPAGGVGMALLAVCCLQRGKDEWKRPRDRDREGFLPAGKRVTAGDKQGPGAATVFFQAGASLVRLRLLLQALLPELSERRGSRPPEL